MQVATIEPGNVDQVESIVRQAATVLGEGGLVVFPTETVYGVAASAVRDAGISKLREMKARDQAQTFTVHLPNPAAAERYVDTSAPALRRFMNKILPGPVTLLLDATDELIEQRLELLGMRATDRNRIYRGNTIGLRCPDQSLSQRILAAIDEPVVASAANRPGGKQPHEAGDAARELDGFVDYVVDGGRTRYAKPSTVVRVIERNGGLSIDVEREGVYDERFIKKLMRWTILLICSGNTCRSPMAEGLAKQILAQQRGVPVEELEASGVRVISAGAFAMPGSPPSPEAIDALAKDNIDISRHRSTPLTPELIHEADVIYTMTESHRQTVIDMMPSASSKTWRLDESGDIADPIGLDLTAYQRTAEMIRRRLDQRLKEQQP